MARRALGPATLRAVRAVETALTDADSRLLVACSGGPDSTALAIATRVVARRRSLPYGAVVVDHGLQPDSAHVAAEAADRLRLVGYEHVEVLPGTIRPAGSGPEAAARELRYGLLGQRARDLDAVVLLGHTLDDQAESVLLGLVRGSGLRSLAGMAERRDRWVRPFLALPRAVVADVCAEAGVVAWEDPHNTDHAFARSRVRARVLPVLEAELGPGVAAALARTARLARADADLLDELAGAAEAGSDAARGAGLDCAWLEDLPLALRHRVLRRWLLGQGARDLAAEHVTAVDRLVGQWHGQQWVEVPGLRVRRVAGRLVR